MIAFEGLKMGRENHVIYFGLKNVQGSGRIPPKLANSPPLRNFALGSHLKLLLLILVNEFNIIVDIDKM